MTKGFIYVANRIKLIALMYVISILCAAVLFSNFEGRPFTDGLWWSVVTALTIGYGDLSPVTAAGRITGVVFGHFWIFGVIPMIIGNIVSRVLEDRDRYTHNEQEWTEDVLEAIAKKLEIKTAPAPKDW